MRGSFRHAWQGACVAFTLGVTACATARLARLTSYGAELEECTRLSATCEESIACENRVRAAHRRPLRDKNEKCNR